MKVSEYVQDLLRDNSVAYKKVSEYINEYRRHHVILSNTLTYNTRLHILNIVYDDVIIERHIRNPNMNTVCRLFDCDMESNSICEVFIQNSLRKLCKRLSVYCRYNTWSRCVQSVTTIYLGILLNILSNKEYILLSISTVLIFAGLIIGLVGVNNYKAVKSLELV